MIRPLCLLLFLSGGSDTAEAAPSVTGSFTLIQAGSSINLSNEGPVDWVHWGLHTETSLDRKAGVLPQISDFTPLDAPAGFVFVYQFSDNANGYSWSDGTPTASVTNSTTGVWAYGTPLIGSGFRISAPADTLTRTLKVYVGAFRARGRLEAYLSDDSAPGYTNTSLFNIGNGSSAVYTLTYSAASAGQQLIVRWTLSTPAGADGNVTLQSAALSTAGANNPPFVALTNPPNNAVFPAGTEIALQANARDLDGNVAKVEFFEGGNKHGEDDTEPFTFSWGNVPAGNYELWARVTDGLGASSDSGRVEVFVHGTGGSVAGSRATPPNLASSINLTAEGTRDWIHWGLATNSLVNRKAAVSPQISDYVALGTNLVNRFSDNYSTFSWSDGSPTVSASTASGVFVYGADRGFQIEVPADTATRTLRVYVGLYAARGSFQVWLSDFSAPAYTDTTFSSSGNGYAVYRIDYSTAAAGQKLFVRYRASSLFDSDFGNVTFQAATLVGADGPASPTLVDPSMNNSLFSFSFATVAGQNYTVQFTDELPAVQWQTLTNVTGDGGTALIWDPGLISTQRFFRVQLP